ncbi:MAG TPA: GNAT family N-acetyltransferase [Ktedonobacterales bacterium]
MAVEIQPLGAERRAWVGHALAGAWGTAEIGTRGRTHRADALPGFVAVRDGQPVGLVTYTLDGDACEIVTLNSWMEGIGAGSALVDAVREAGRAAGSRRVWLITTNDNVSALRFYQKRGFRLVAVHRGAVNEARALKPEIPLVGEQGIPIHDEIELELIIAPTPRAPGAV